MERKKYAQVCGVCGKQETTGLTTHAQRKHDGMRQELLEGEVPFASWSEEWFEKLSPEMQSRYTTSNSKKQDISNAISEKNQNKPDSNNSTTTQELSSKNAEMNNKMLLSQNSLHQKFESHPTKRNASRNTQPTINDGLFKSLRKTKQKELEEKILFLESQVNELQNGSPDRSQFTISDLPSGVAFENERLKKEIAILQDQVLQSLLRNSQSNQSKSTNESDNPRSQQLPSDTIGSADSAGGFTLRMLRDMLDQRDSELKQLREELMEYKLADPHSQCKQTIKLLETQLKSVQMERDKYREHRDDLAGMVSNKVIDVMEQHMNEANISESSLQSDNDHSRDDFDLPIAQTSIEDQQMQHIDTSSRPQQRNDYHVNEEERKEADVTVTCLYCMQCVIGPPHIMKANNGVIEISGALYNHWSAACSYFDVYHRKLKMVATEALKSRQKLLQPELQLTLQQDGDKVIQCFKLSVAFEQSNAELITFLDDWKITRKESYPFLSSIIDSGVDVGVTDELELLYKFGRLNQQHSYHKSEGYMRWVGGEFVTVTQQIVENALTTRKMKEFRYRCTTCKKLFSCEVGWRKHTEWMIVCGEIKEKELTKLEALIATTMEKLELIKPEKFKSALETRRDIQREDSLQFADEHKDKLPIVESWLTALSAESEKGQLQPQGPSICDAIVYPRCPKIFGQDIQKHDQELKLFLKSHDIAVRTVGNTTDSDPTTAFVYLLDSDNEYTAELMQKLQKSLDDLASKIMDAVPPSEEQKYIIQAQLANLYIRQTDYTKDYLSFLIVKSLDENFNVLREIGYKIGMPFSEAHSQLFTSIQFQSFAEDASGKLVRVQRLKAYNKWVHLLLTTSFKAALSMGTSKLFKGPAAFHMNKLQPSFNDGLLRIELSSYYYTVQQWKSEALQMQQWNKTISSMERALQEVKEQLIYKVSLKVFWNSFWFSVDAATAIIDFQADLWTIVYAHSSRSYLLTGHHTDKHAKSGAQLTFLQRFASVKTLVRVNNGEKTKYFLIVRHGHPRQIPISSLNVKQVEENRMPIDMTTWFYHLSKEQLNQIYFTCDNQQEFDEWFGQDPALGRPDMSEFENQTDQSMSDAEEQIPQSNLFQQYNEVIDTSSQQISERKREENKKRSRSRSRDNGIKRDKSKSQKRKEEIERNKNVREEVLGDNVTPFIVPFRDSKGKRFKVFTNELSHQYNTECRFSSNNRGVSYECSHCNRQLKTKGQKKDQLFIV